MPTDNAFVELLHEIDILAPGWENILQADFSPNLVRIVMAHQAEIGIYRGTELFEESDALSMRGGLFIEGNHRRDKVASCAVGDIYATGRQAARRNTLQREISRQEFAEFARHDGVMPQATQKPFSHVHCIMQSSRLIARWLNDRTDHFCALGIVLEVDFIGVQGDVQLIGKESLDFLDESATFL